VNTEFEGAYTYLGKGGLSGTTV